MSDRIAVMNRGRVEQLDSATAIYQRPTTAFVARFIGGGNVFDCVVDGDALRLPGGETVRVVDATGATAVSIRPERVALSRTALNEVNEIPVTVVEQIFRGSVDQLQVRTPGGLMINVVAEQGIWKRDDRASACLRAADLVVLRRAD